MRICKHIKPNKEPCQANTMKNSEFCYFHDPKLAKRRAEARKRGGINRRVGKRIQPAIYQISSVKDIQKILEDALNDAVGLENSHARARTIGYLCQINLKAFEVGDLESRIKALEERI